MPESNTKHGYVLVDRKTGGFFKAPDCKPDTDGYGRFYAEDLEAVVTMMVRHGLSPREWAIKRFTYVVGEEVTLGGERARKTA